MKTKLTSLAATVLVLAASLVLLYRLISVDGGAVDSLVIDGSIQAAAADEPAVGEPPPLLAPERTGFAKRELVTERQPEGGAPLANLRGRLSSREIHEGRSLRVLLHFWDEDLAAPRTAKRSPDPSLTGVGGIELHPVSETRVASTDHVGRFRFDGLPPGVYGVTVEPSARRELLYGDVELGPGETVDLGELRITAAHRWGRDRPNPIRYDRGDLVAAGPGAPEWYAADDGRAFRMVTPKGKLNVCPPYHPYLVSGQALQYVLESPVLPPDTVLSATEIGGLKPPNNASVTHTVTGCIFHGLIPGEYSVKVTLLLKNAQGRWLPTGLRSKGTAKVVGGQTIACEWSRN